jgi:IS30 family transposase
MPKGYHHLTLEIRCQIYALLQSGLDMAEIGRQLHIDRSTIKREIGRNSGKRGYRYKQAQAHATASRFGASGQPRKMTPALIRFIEKRLRQDQWSPEQISGRLKQQKGVSVSALRIYQHIWNDRKSSGNLYLQLRHAGKKYNRRMGKTSGRGLIPDRVDIDQRPAIVDRKSRIGDWEADTIIGAKQKGVIMSHVERKSKYTKLAKLPDKSSNSVVKACARVLTPLADRIKTITYDNGKEFAAHKKIAQSLHSLSFFAKPYHSWERGLNEHTNGLVRQYFPKASDLSILSSADIRKVEKKLNARPRKVLNFKTPNEVFVIS